MELPLRPKYLLLRPVTLRYKYCNEGSNELLKDYTELKQKCFKLYNEGLKFYYEKRWGKAEEIFKKVLNGLPEDAPSSVFLNWCQKYKQTSPPENWGGLCTMETK